MKNNIFRNTARSRVDILTHLRLPRIVYVDTLLNTVFRGPISHKLMILHKLSPNLQIFSIGFIVYIYWSFKFK